MSHLQEKEKIEKIIDELYYCYEAENSLQWVRYLHPMFRNGTYSKDNSCQPPEPDKLMTKDEFINKMNSEGEEYRWQTAFQVLYNHITKKEIK
jgi:hypothetical protein